MSPMNEAGCFRYSDLQNAFGQGLKLQVKRMNADIAGAMHRHGVLGGLIGVRPGSAKERNPARL